MKVTHLLAIFSVFTIGSGLNIIYAQTSIAATLSRWNRQSIPYAYAEDIAQTSNILFLDARETEEFTTSHIQNAIHVGYKKFDMNRMLQMLPNKDTAIVVYCSVGVRSEHVGEQLKKNGYTHVQNLYGGIFEWKNKGLPVYNIYKKQTDSVHAFNKKWGRLLKKGIKVY